MTVNEILREWLVAHGCDGLCDCDEMGSDGCGCTLDDFMPCGYSRLECVAAKSGPVPEGESDEYDFWMTPFVERKGLEESREEAERAYVALNLAEVTTAKEEANGQAQSHM